MNTSTHSARRNSIVVAVFIAVGLCAWMLSGLGNAPEDTSAAIDRNGARASTMRVQVRESAARQITREIVVTARTEPNRDVELKAETSGTVVAIGVERGRSVGAGVVIVELDMAEREAQLAETQALIRQRELEFAAGERLRGQDFVTAAQFAEIEANLELARASRARAQLDIRRTRIAAPFDAVLQERPVEIGDYVGVGDTVAYLVDTDPIIVVGDVNERDISALELDGPGTARLGGEVLEGTVRYISPVADEGTRSFRVELAVANSDGKLRAGRSAELLLNANRIRAHTLSAGLLTLADDGAVGIKAVDENNRVRFMPVEIVGSGADGLLVTGLPDSIRLITVGQGFVSDGQAVEPVPENTSAAVTRGGDDTSPSESQATQALAVQADTADNERPY